MTARTLGLAVFATLLASCAPTPAVQRGAYVRALQTAPGNAQPSNLVAREIEMAKRASEVGRMTALEEFGIPEAFVISRAGEVSPRGLAEDAVESRIATWSPKTVWMSCDGRSGVSEGRFEDADGKVGDYITGWRRNGETGEYEWVRTAAALDDPQPPARPAPAPVQPGEIVVDGLVSVKGNVADCKPRPGARPAVGASTQELSSGDQTLAWLTTYAEGERIVEVRAWTQGEWQTVLKQRWTATRP